MPITALGLNCTLSRSPTASSTQKMLDLVLEALAERDVRCDSVRLVDCNIPAGVQASRGAGDDWPSIRAAIRRADLLVVATPIWMGQGSSLMQRMFERMDATFGEENDQGQLWTFSKVAIACVVGNEDGAHHVCSQAYQALTDLGFTIPGGGGAYWVGTAMGDKDFKDLASIPRNLRKNIRILATHAVHLAGLLQSRPYPPPGRPS